MNNKINLETITQVIINHHGFSSNTVRGFSCYIPDRSPFPSTEGLLLWSFSKTYKRIETQIQKYSSNARIYRMEEMLNIPVDNYKREIVGLVQEYLDSLSNTKVFHPIGSGLLLFGHLKVYNLAADLNSFAKSPLKLRELEQITVNNPITKFCESAGYFKVQNREEMVLDKIINKIL